MLVSLVIHLSSILYGVRMAQLNLENIPGKQISGLDTNELEWVTEESSDRFLKELSKDFLDFLEGSTYTEIQQDILKELDELEKQGIPNSSQKQMNEAIVRLKSFLQEKSLSPDILRVPIGILDTYLRYFYSELKTKDGKYYAPASLVCIRAGIHRYFMLNRPEVNVNGDQRFVKSNRMLKTMVAKYKTSNQVKNADKYPAVAKEDLLKIREYFDRHNSEVLQEEVMFNLIFHFALRGRETLPLLTRDSISVATDADGKRYLKLNHELLSKNAKASLKNSEYEDLKKARIYENQENTAECPVTCFELYLSKLPSTSLSLFPKPCKNESKGLSGWVWYTKKQSVGKNTIDNLMARLSQRLSLSKRYTNHCLRVTHITVLKENGFSNSEIAANTGHKNPASIERYHRKRRDRDFQTMSSALQVEASSRRVTIHPLSKSARIVAEEAKSNAISIPSIPSSTSLTMNFQGTFKNCSFNFYSGNN